MPEASGSSEAWASSIEVLVCTCVELPVPHYHKQSRPASYGEGILASATSIYRRHLITPSPHHPITSSPRHLIVSSQRPITSFPHSNPPTSCLHYFRAICRQMSKAQRPKENVELHVFSSSETFGDDLVEMPACIYPLPCRYDIPDSRPYGSSTVRSATICASSLGLVRNYLRGKSTPKQPFPQNPGKTVELPMPLSGPFLVQG